MMSNLHFPRDQEPRTGEFAGILDKAHNALRRIDAGDNARPVPQRDLDAVSDAVSAIEKFARKLVIRLSEFGR